LTTGPNAISEAKADAAEIVILEDAVSADVPDYDALVVAALTTADPAPASQALIVSKTYGKDTTSLSALGTALAASGELTTGGGPFIQNLFELDKSQTDQESFIEGFSVNETPSQLETTASNIVAGATTALNAASRTDIALGLYISGTTTTSGTGVATILTDVTEGVTSGYTTSTVGTAFGADKDIATLVLDIISALGASSAETVAGAGALELQATAGADVAYYAKTVSKDSAIAADTTGVTEANTAAGVGNEYALTSSTDQVDIQYKSYVTQGVVGAYSKYAAQIVDAVAEQILQESYTSAQFAASLGLYVRDITTDNVLNSVLDGLAPNDALDSTMLQALAQYASGFGNAAGNNSVIATLAVQAILGSETLPSNDLAKNHAAVVLATLQYFAGSGSASTVQAIASAVAQNGTGSGEPTPDLVTSALITAAKTGTTVIEEIIQGAATNAPAVTALGGTDTFLKTVAGELAGSASDIGDIATGLAELSSSFTPVQVATDLTDGAEKDYATIAETLAGEFPSLAPNIAGVMSNSTSVDALAAPDGVRYKIALDILATVGVSSTEAAAVSGSVAAPITVNADRVTLAEDVAAVYQSQGAGIADAISNTVATSDATYVSDLDAVAAGVIKKAPATILTTSTSVEQIVLTGSGDPVITGTTFANTVQGLTGGLPVVVAIAQVAAADQTVAEAGSVGALTAQLKDVVSSVTVTGSIAAAVAAAATETILPTGLNNPNPMVDDSNYSYYTVASAFGSYSANTKLLPDFGGTASTSSLTGVEGSIANALAADLQQAGISLANPAHNQAAAAIAWDLITQLLADETTANSYSSKSAGYIEAIAQAVVAADPAAAADVYGYAAEAVELAAAAAPTTWTAKDGTNNTVLNVFLLALQTDVEDAVTLADSADAATINPVVSSVYTSGSNNQLTEFSAGDGTYITADETPIIND
jgi:hypothetical protein